jgi:hypothetical protein
VLITDTLRSYGVAHRRLMASVAHRRSTYLHNRGRELPPTHPRERAMKKFRSPGGAPRFLSAFSDISPHFRPGRHNLTASAYRDEMNTPIRHLKRGRQAARRRLIRGHPEATSRAWTARSPPDTNNLTMPPSRFRHFA